MRLDFPSLPVLALVASLLVAGPLRGEGDGRFSLLWKNGDSVPGQLIGGDASTLHWKAEGFAEPFRIDVEHLRHLAFPAPSGEEEAARTPSNDFLFLLSNGDRVYGDLVAIEERSIVMRSERFFAPVRLSLDAVVRIEQIRGGRTRLTGPFDLDRWLSKGRNRKVSEWEAGLRGEFETHQWNADLFRPIAFPESVEIAFALETEHEAPDFQVALIREGEKGPRLETWGDTLVLTHGARFDPVVTLDPERRRLSLRLFWNQQSGDLRVCDSSGNELASLAGVTVPPAETGPDRRPTDDFIRGFALVNRTSALRLTHLSIREWNGRDVPVFDADKPRIETRSGDTLLGLRELRLPGGSGTLEVDGRGMALAEVSEIILSGGEPSVRAEDGEATAHVAWYDGTTISGTLRRLSRDRCELRPAWCAEPVEARLAEARRLVFPEPDASFPEPPDRITIGDLSLAGTLRPGDNGNPPSSLLAWRPLGAREASPLSGTASAEVMRGGFGATVPIANRSRLYLVNGEILVGRLLAIDEDEIRFTSEITGDIAIPSRFLRAIDLAGSALALQGFDDPGWTVFHQDAEEADAELGGDSLLLRGGAAGHPHLLVGDRVRFHANWRKSHGAMTVKLFASGHDDSAASTDIILAAQGNRMFVGKLKKGGAFSFSGEQVPISDNEADFEILARPEQVEVRVNGKNALTLEVEEDLVSGNGIYFKTGGGWQGWNSEDNEIEITRFAIERSPGYVPQRVIDPRARENALTIPRFHRDDPPRHLLVAPNGDLLRGTLHAYADRELAFTSRDTELTLPASRVASIVWLREASGGENAAAPEDGGAEDESGAEDAESDPEEAVYAEREANPGTPDYQQFPITHDFLLRDGSRLKLAAEETVEDRIVGRSFILGKCTVPLGRVRTFKVGPPTPLHQRSDPEGAVGYADWAMTFAPDPVIPGTEAAAQSPLLGKPAPDFTLTMLDESRFSLREQRGKVVVLDFWATWCGPCIRAMPEVRRVVDAFEGQPVVLCAVNQAETPPIVAEFLETREWEDLPVALDFRMDVSRSYEVEGIPHTVVIAPDGTVSWVHSGFDDNLAGDLADAIAKALAQR